MNFAGKLYPRKNCWFAEDATKVTIHFAQNLWQIQQRNLAGNVRLVPKGWKGIIFSENLDPFSIYAWDACTKQTINTNAVMISLYYTLTGILMQFSWLKNSIKDHKAISSTNMFMATMVQSGTWNKVHGLVGIMSYFWKDLKSYRKEQQIYLPTNFECFLRLWKNFTVNSRSQHIVCTCT